MVQQKMRGIAQVDDLNGLRLVVAQDLKEFGIKIPKDKKNKNKDDSPVSI